MHRSRGRETRALFTPLALSSLRDCSEPAGRCASIAPHRGRPPGPICCPSGLSAAVLFLSNNSTLSSAGGPGTVKIVNVTLKRQNKGPSGIIFEQNRPPKIVSATLSSLRLIGYTGDTFCTGDQGQFTYALIVWNGDDYPEIWSRHGPSGGGPRRDLKKTILGHFDQNRPPKIGWVPYLA